jgi:hypothetical protein
MPKLSDAINKVNQEEAQRKRPAKRRPYLDNLVSSSPFAEDTQPIAKKSPTPIALKAEPIEEILKNQISIPPKNLELKSLEKSVQATEVVNTQAPPVKTIVNPVEEKHELPQKEKEVEEFYEADVESQSFNFLPSSVEQKLKPLSNFFPDEIVPPPVVKPTIKQRPIVIPNPINNSQFMVNPRGTMGTDEEDGVDLSLYTIEEFGVTTKTVLYYIFRKAKEVKCLVTPPLKKNDLLKDCGLNLNTIKSVLQRLSHYKFIKLEKYQRGPFGWTRYSIRESLYNQLLHDYNFDPGHSTPGPKSWETNNVEQKFSGVGEDLTIPDNLKELGFNMGHVKQLQKMQITNDKIQTSLDAFAFDMQDKEFKQKIRSPLSVFMKVAKTEGEYISSRGYISPEDEIMQQMIQLKKDRALHAKKQQDELLNLSFNEWLATKTKDEITKIAPPSGDYLGPLHKAELKNWYQENVFDIKS